MVIRYRVDREKYVLTDPFFTLKRRPHYRKRSLFYGENFRY